MDIDVTHSVWPWIAEQAGWWRMQRGGDAKIPDLRRMSALCGICRKDVKEQMMMMRLDEIGEYYNNIKAKVVSRPTRPNKHEEGRTVCMYRWR